MKVLSIALIALIAAVGVVGVVLLQTNGVPGTAAVVICLFAMLVL